MVLCVRLGAFGERALLEDNTLLNILESVAIVLSQILTDESSGGPVVKSERSNPSVYPQD